MKPISHTLGIAALLVAVLGVTSCGFIARAGARPDVAALDGLVVGQSSVAEVKAALGEPYGTGRAFLPFQASAGEMWSYYYEEGTLEDDRRTFLFVYLRDGVYDGYMWFSSLPGAEQPAGAPAAQ
jgi:hypothetical protein